LTVIKKKKKKKKEKKGGDTPASSRKREILLQYKLLVEGASTTPFRKRGSPSRCNGLGKGKKDHLRALQNLRSRGQQNGVSAIKKRRGVQPFISGGDFQERERRRT